MSINIGPHALFFFLLFNPTDTHHNEREVVIDMPEAVPGRDDSPQHGGGPIGSRDDREMCGEMYGEDETDSDDNVGITVNYSGVEPAYSG